MAHYNPSDNEYAITRETQAGVTPASGAWLRVPHVPGNDLSFNADNTPSNIQNKGRQAGGTRRGNYRVEGNLKTHFQRSKYHDLLLEAVFSGKFIETGAAGDKEDVLKGSNIDSPLSVEKKLNGSPNYWITDKGCYVSKMTLTADASSNSNVETTWDFVGMNRTNLPTASAGLTYTDAENTLRLHSQDVKNITIAGLGSVEYTKIELTVEQARENKSALGKAYSVGVGTASARNSTLSVTFYRENFQPETVLGNAGVDVSFTVGDDDEGYTFRLPNATPSLPQNEESGASMLVTVVFTASADAATGTDIMVTRN